MLICSSSTQKGYHYEHVLHLQESSCTASLPDLSVAAKKSCMTDQPVSSHGKLMPTKLKALPAWHLQRCVCISRQGRQQNQSPKNGAVVCSQLHALVQSSSGGHKQLLEGLSNTKAFQLLPCRQMISVLASLCAASMLLFISTMTRPYEG